MITRPSDHEQVIAKHRRHVELSPGVGEDVQRYALAVLDDVAIDLAALEAGRLAALAPVTAGGGVDDAMAERLLDAMFPYGWAEPWIGTAKHALTAALTQDPQP